MFQLLLYISVIFFADVSGEVIFQSGAAMETSQNQLPRRSTRSSSRIFQANSEPKAIEINSSQIEDETIYHSEDCSNTDPDDGSVFAGMFLDIDVYEDHESNLKVLDDNPPLPIEELKPKGIIAKL